ncbi:MAG: phosphate--acyl-ACP acyltransferase, partial [Spirochaetia bacterium]|nr:phosphate--acyl-ACP acyltransferase [Spirochaetia bacterium]
IIKEEISNNLISKFGALLMQEVFGKLRSQLDAASHGGAPLLGIAKPVYIGHGSSDAETVVSAVKKMHMGMEVRFTERMAEDIARYG